MKVSELFGGLRDLVGKVGAERAKLEADLKKATERREFLLTAPLHRGDVEGLLAAWRDDQAKRWRASVAKKISILRARANYGKSPGQLPFSPLVHTREHFNPTWEPADLQVAVVGLLPEAFDRVIGGILDEMDWSCCGPLIREREAELPKLDAEIARLEAELDEIETATRRALQG